MQGKYTTAEKIGIVIAIILGLPVLLLILLIVWQILISLGFDLAPR
jgi:hypothetical protein